MMTTGERSTAPLFLNSGRPRSILVHSQVSLSGDHCHVMTDDQHNDDEGGERDDDDYDEDYHDKQEDDGGL